MGIVQRQKSEIENLKAKNRMIKRMYESQRKANAEIQLSYLGLNRALKLIVLRLGGEVKFTQDDLKKSDKYEVVGVIHTDGTLELLAPEFAEEKKAQADQERK